MLENILSFTPNLLSASILEKCLIGQQSTLTKMQANVWRNIDQQSNHFMLLNGPAGIGKSHLLTLFRHRLCADQSLAQYHYLVSVDEYGDAISDYLDLLLLILKQLADCTVTHHLKHDIAAKIAALYNLSARQFSIQAEQLLLNVLADKPLLILCENLDTILLQWSVPCMQQFKRLLDGTDKISIIATATTDFSLLTQAKRHPFHHCFDVCQLTVLDHPQAFELISKVSNTNLVTSSFAHSMVAVNALQHLFGGIARYYVHFAQRLKSQPLDEFNAIVLQLLNDAWPVQYAKLQQLAPQQRKIIHFLCHQQETVSVCDIAKINRISQQTASGQLKKLRDQGMVMSTMVGRKAHYEMASPLIRLTLSMKNGAIDNPATNHCPKHLVAERLDFLKHWFITTATGLPCQDGECFVFNSAWLQQKYLPQSLPLVIRLQHQIEGYLQQLSQGISHSFDELRDKINALTHQFDTTLTTSQSRTMLLSHLDLLYGLGCHHLVAGQTELARLLCQDMFALALPNTDPSLWQHLAQLIVGLSTFFAINKQIDAILPFIAQLERREINLHNLNYSTQLSHCYIAKAKGYALANDKAKTYQVLEQLRMRADKRNSAQIAGAFAHGVKATMDFIAKEDPKHAFRLLKQVQDISHKHGHQDLLFSCTRAYWAAQPQSMRFGQLLNQCEQVSSLATFNTEVYLILLALTQQDSEQQLSGYQTLWQTLVKLNQTMIFAAACTQVAIALTKQSRGQYDAWLNITMNLLDKEPRLRSTSEILVALQRYLQYGNDVHQLLVLPQEIRTLVADKLTT